MGLERYVVDAVVLEGRNPTEIARLHGISRSWLYRLLERYLQLQLDGYRSYYNAERPHRALRGRTPLQAFDARLKARPLVDRSPAHYRVRQDRVSKAGNVTVRYLSRLRHIGLGKAHAGEPVGLLIADDHVRVVRQDGSLHRELVLDVSRDY